MEGLPKALLLRRVGRRFQKCSLTAVPFVHEPCAQRATVEACRPLVVSNYVDHARFDRTVAIGASVDSLPSVRERLTWQISVTPACLILSAEGVTVPNESMRAAGDRATTRSSS